MRVPAGRRFALAAVAAAVAVTGVLVWRAASTSTPVSRAEALEGYREQQPGGAPAVPGRPAPGVYTYRASGTERGDAGPLSVSRAVPAEVQAVVSPVAGGVQMEWRISEEHTQSYRYRVAADWWTTTWRRVDVTFVGLGRDDRRDVTPPARWMPSRPVVGSRWPVRFRTGTLRTAGTGRVLRKGTLPLDGAQETVYLVRTVTRTSGTHGGSRTEDVWWSPRLAMPVRVSADTRLDGVVGFRSRLRMDLAAAAPAR